METNPGFPRPRPRRRFLPWALIAIGIGVAVVFVVVLGNWITVSFSGQIDTPFVGCTYGCLQTQHTESLPAGRNVTVNWADESGGHVGFVVLEPGPGYSPVPHCSWIESSSGSCSFESLGGIYSFGAANSPGTTTGQLVDYSGSYLTSIL